MARKDAEIKISLIDGVSKGLGSIQRGIGSLGKSLTSVKGLAVQAAAAFGLFKVGSAFADGVKSAGDFEAKLKEVQAVSGATAEQLEKMRAVAIKSAEDAGFSFVEATEGLGELARATGDVEKAMASLPSVLSLAKAGGLGVAEAAEITTTTLTQFGLAAEESGRIADVLAKAANATTSNVQQLGLSLSYAAPLARQLGLELEPTVAIIGALADQGFRGERAGTALRNVFSQLADPASKFSKALDGANIKSRDFTTIIGELAKRADGGKSVLLALDSEARPAIIALARDGGKAIQGLSKDLDDAAGSAAKTAAVINSGFNASLANLQREIGKFGLNFLEPLLGPLGEQFDALRGKIAEFAASPEFESLRTNFRDVFLQAIEAVKKFASEFDFKDAVQSVQDFVKSTGEGLQTFKETTAQVAAAVRLAVEGIAAVFNSLKTVVSGAVAAVSKSASSLLGAFDVIASRTEGLRDVLDDVGNIASEKAGEGFADLTKNVEAAGQQIDIMAGVTGAATDELAKQPPVLQQISDDALRMAENANKLAAAEEAAAVAAREFAKEQDAAGTALGEIAGKAGGAIDAMNGIAEASANEIKAFKDTQAEIQKSIDATKKFAASADDAAESVADIGTAAEGARNQIEEDLSSAIFQGLSEGIARTAEGMAALGGVAESAIRDRLQAATKGALNGFVGLNNEIQRLDAILSSPAGAEQLERAARAAADLAEKIATATDRARGLAQAQRDLTAALQEEADARDLSDREREQRRFAEEQRQIEELAKQRGFHGAAEAERQRQLSKANHEARLLEINAEAAERVRSELAADEEIAGRRAAGQAAVFARGESGAGETDNIGGRGGISLTVNVHALTGQQAIDEAARALIDPIQRLQKARL